MKSKLTRPQVIVLILSVLMIVLILLLPRVPENLDSESPTVEKTVDLPSDQLLSEFRNSLSADKAEKIQFLEDKLAAATTIEDKLRWCDSLSLHARVYGIPEIEAEYLWQRAELSGAVKSWFLAGDAYFNNYRSSAEKYRKYMIGKAIDCYNHILDMEPDNLKARNALGVSYVEGATYLGEQPMKGIGMIREVLEMDPENIDALVNLGYFAIKSGQYDKAIERYQKVLEIDSGHIEAFLYLTDIYVTIGDKQNAVASLEKYRENIKDQEKIVQIDSYIEEIKKSN